MQLNSVSILEKIVKSNCALFYFYFHHVTRNFISDLFLIRACLPYDNKSILPFHLFQSSSFVIFREYLKFTDSRNVQVLKSLYPSYMNFVSAYW